MKKKFTFPADFPSQSVRVYFELKISDTDYYAYGQIYKNDVSAGTERITNQNTYQPYSEDFDVSASMEVQLYLHSSNGVADAYAQNFRILGSNQPGTYDISGADV